MKFSSHFKFQNYIKVRLEANFLNITETNYQTDQ